MVELRMGLTGHADCDDEDALGGEVARIRGGKASA